MSHFLARLQRCKDAGDAAPLIDAIPYAKMLGLELAVQGQMLVAKMPFADHLVGNPSLPAIHGGTLGALLESAAGFQLVWEAEPEVLPKIITITIDFLRSGKPRDTFATARVSKRGRRVAIVRAEAWQDDPERPIATANAHFLIRPGRVEG